MKEEIKKYYSDLKLDFFQEKEIEQVVDDIFMIFERFEK